MSRKQNIAGIAIEDKPDAIGHTGCESTEQTRKQ
jgi:hypothetical protein